MQGLILAAGMGKRLGKYTNNQTKCMVKVNNKTLIHHALDALSKAGIKKVVMVVGYEGEKLRDFLGNCYKDISITYVDNNIYDKTNNIYSLWLAQDYLKEDDTLLLESDIIFEPDIIQDIVNNKEPNLAVVAKYEPWMDGTVTLVDDDNNILSFIPKINFDWDNKDNYYKTVNIYKFSKDFSVNYYLPFLNAYIQAMGENEYYEQVLRVISSLEGINIKAHKLSNQKWYEIDDVQDLDIANAIFSDTKHKLKLFQKRYGGYWRFPRLIDFCYLVNPYFPTSGFMSEIKSNFETLISQYPSGLSIQDLMAAKMFSCDSTEIIVGNGAAELIRGVLNNISGTIGVIYPTFNEYAESAGMDRVKQFITSAPDFAYTVDDLKKFASTGINALVLINPDNPSGHYFSYEEMIELIEYLNKKNIYIIYDESFIDFAGKDCAFSLISSSILQKYKNLIAIKSISKSYGVPGLRLGVAASGNNVILEAIRKYLPIWNINSFGEYFLQIIDKYKNDYAAACSKICAERDDFFKQLSKIEYLKVLPSKSNYFLCEITKKYTATELTSLLFYKHCLLIKDCTGKTGLGTNHIRIAVKDHKENALIIDKLMASI